MAKYKVLRPIEHNHVLFAPEGWSGPDKVASGADGQEIAVDRSGVIELEEPLAAQLIAGQVPLHEGRPDPLGAAEAREKLAAREKAEREAKLASEQKELEEFRAFQVAKKKK